MSPQKAPARKTGKGPLKKTGAPARRTPSKPAATKKAQAKKPATKAAAKKAAPSRRTPPKPAATKKAQAKRPPTKAAAKKTVPSRRPAPAKPATKPAPSKTAAKKGPATGRPAPAKATGKQRVPASTTRPPAEKAASKKRGDESAQLDGRHGGSTGKVEEPAAVATTSRASTAKGAPAAAPATRPAPKAAPAPAPRPTPPPKPTRGPYADDEKFLEEQRQLLLSERAVYQRQADDLRAEAESLALEREPGDVQFDEESGEGGTVAVDRERDLALSAQAIASIEEIDRALAAIADKTYGYCENCGQPIPKARLRALPFARLCVGCKSGGLHRR